MYDSVANAGDVTDDGFPSLLVQVNPEYAPGYVWVYAGSASGLSSAPVATLTDGVTLSYFGESMFGATN